jgi:xyloglucan fucosyltransferase
MVLVGFLLTLPLLFLVFGGRWGSGSFPSSSPSPPVVARNVAAGDRGATPQSKSKLPALCYYPVVSACEFGRSRPSHAGEEAR